MDEKLTKLFRKTIKFAFLMIAVGLFLGIFTREMTRMLAKFVDYQTLMPLQTNIMLSHGHAILIGAILPLALLFVTWLVRNSLNEKDIKSLHVAANHTFAGAVLTLLLMLYKKMAFIIALAAAPTESWAVVDKSLFGGIPALRIIAHTIAHPILAVGIAWWMMILWRNVKKSQTF